MLSRKHYPADLVERARRQFSADVDAWRSLAEAAPEQAAAHEARHFANLVIALDAWFVHRMRGQEGKDGNPLNEVRSLVASLIDHDRVYTPDPKMRLDPDRTLLGLRAGDDVAIGVDDFARLLPAFCDEIAARFPDG